MNKNKVLGFMCLYYGRDFLRESLLSVKNHIDKMHISYTRTPSQGFGTNIPCPDKEQELRKIAKKVLGDKLIWKSYNGFGQESEHRNTRYKYSDKYKLILTIDADEVFKEEDIDTVLEYASKNKERYYGITGYINFWRSFSWYCTDDFRPIRVENVTVKNQLQNLNNCKMEVYHFSTCQREEIMRFKYKIFGHADELRKNYLDSVYYAWTPETKDIITHLHPTTTGIWGTALPFDKTTLPSYLKEHPNYTKELV